MSEDIKVAMAVRDLMSAVLTLSELPADQVKQEWCDIELAHLKLSTVMDNIYDRDIVRNLRLRSHGYKEAASRSMALREVSST